MTLPKEDARLVVGISSIGTFTPIPAYLAPFHAVTVSSTGGAPVPKAVSLAE